MTWTARTGCGGVRGFIEIQIRRVLVFRSVSVAISVTAPLGRAGHESLKRPSETSVGRPSTVRVAPGSSVPASATGCPDGMTTPGAPNTIFGPVVSTRMFHVLVVREPGNPPATVACTRCGPSGRWLPSRTKRPAVMYALPVTSRPSSFQRTRSSTVGSAPTENFSDGSTAGPTASAVGPEASRLGADSRAPRAKVAKISAPRTTPTITNRR